MIKVRRKKKPSKINKQTNENHKHRHAMKIQFFFSLDDQPIDTMICEAQHKQFSYIAIV